VRKAEYAVSARIFVNESFTYVIQVKGIVVGHFMYDIRMIL
jgi:hypothetical protein